MKEWGEPTYKIGADEKGYPSITCLVCKRTSYNKHDIQNKYCGNCHQFHDIMMAQRELEKGK